MCRVDTQFVLQENYLCPSPEVTQSINTLLFKYLLWGGGGWQGGGKKKFGVPDFGHHRLAHL